MNVAEDVIESLSRRPSRVALVIGRSALASGHLAERARRVSAALHATGLRAGDTVALAVRPSASALAAFLGAARIGLRVALVDPFAGAELVAARLRRADTALIIADASAQVMSTMAAPVARRMGLHLPNLPSIAPVATIGRRTIGLAPSIEDHTFPDPGPVDGDDALIIFTSGTTAAPRAVVHTHRSIAEGLGAIRSLIDVREGHTVMGGTFFVMVPALMAGATVILPPRRARSVAGLFADRTPDVSYLTPPQLRDILAEAPRLHGRIFAGSAPVTTALLGRLKAAGADEAWGVYAMSEAFPVAAVEEREKAAYAGPGDLLGRPFAGVEVTVDDIGQLCVHGAGVCDRYLGEARLGAVASGDRGVVDSDGRIVMQGRLKDMILRAAENIYPGLYEPALHVQGVASALLLGVPDLDGDEEVVLLIECEEGIAQSVVERRLRAPLDAMGFARPTRIVFARIPTHGRSRKPDRDAARRLVAR